MYVMPSLNRLVKKIDSWLGQMVVMFLWCPMFDVTKRTKHDSCLFMLMFLPFFFFSFGLVGTWDLENSIFLKIYIQPFFLSLKFS